MIIPPTFPLDLMRGAIGIAISPLVSNWEYGTDKPRTDDFGDGMKVTVPDREYIRASDIPPLSERRRSGR